jgi:hypothetical protein
MGRRCCISMLLLAILLLFGCAGGKESVRAGGNSLAPLGSPDFEVSVSAAYMSAEDLVTLVGKTSNPFLSWGNNPLMVFDVSVGGASRDVQILYDAFELRYAGGSRSPLPHFYITQYWTNKLNRYSANKSIEDWVSNRKTYSRWSSGKVTYNVNKYMIPAKKQVKAGGEYEGLVVFEGAPPKSGNLILTVPLYSETGQPLAVLDFEYTPLS